MACFVSKTTVSSPDRGHKPERRKRLAEKKACEKGGSKELGGKSDASVGRIWTSEDRAKSMTAQSRGVTKSASRM